MLPYILVCTTWGRRQMSKSLFLFLYWDIHANHSYKSTHYNWRTENGSIMIGAGKSWKNFIKWYHLKYSKMSSMPTEWMGQRRHIRLREESCPVDEKLLSAYLHSKYSILKRKKHTHTHTPQKKPSRD